MQADSPAVAAYEPGWQAMQTCDSVDIAMLSSDNIIIPSFVDNIIFPSFVCMYENICEAYKPSGYIPKLGYTAVYHVSFVFHARVTM